MSAAHATPHELFTAHPPDTLFTVLQAVMQADVSVMITSAQGIIEFVNPAFERHSGYAAHEAIGRKPDLLKSGLHPPEFFAGLWSALGAGKVFRAVFTNQHKDGKLYREEQTITPIRNAQAEISHHLSTGRLLTKPTAANDVRADPANYDTLTGTPNRRLFTVRLERAIDHCRSAARRCTLLHIDLDHFRRINDTLGHNTGDRVIAALAKRISERVAGDSLLARLGGDEFAVVVEHAANDDADTAGAAGRQLAAALIDDAARPLTIGERTLHAAVSIGIATYPEDGEDVDTLLRHAEIAMYQAKSAGRGQYAEFSAEMGKKVLDDLSIEDALREALHKREFEVYFQPIVSPDDCRCVALEALLRWHSPLHGTVSPARFIPLLEDSGQITTVGRWVLQTACEQFKALAQAPGMPQVLAVNLSGHQFRDAHLVDDVRAILQSSGLAARQLELEITESVLVDDASAAGRTLHALSAIGVRLAIDDFGTGYSSLSYLRSFPIDTLKIDRSFVAEMESSIDAKVIIRSIVNLAHNLGMTVVAEGVESLGQLALLADLGCARTQGFLFSRPLPIGELKEKLARPFAVAGRLDGSDGIPPKPALRRTVSNIPHKASEKHMQTILLVDDSTTILLSISSILGKAGYAVEKAANAEEALKKFNAGIKVNLLITDLNMPGMNGIELIREVRKLPAYKFLPILFLTTESQQAKKQEAKAAGASGWIVKPATADELLSTIKLVIR